MVNLIEIQIVEKSKSIHFYLYYLTARETLPGRKRYISQTLITLILIEVMKKRFRDTDVQIRLR